MTVRNFGSDRTRLIGRPTSRPARRLVRRGGAFVPPEDHGGDARVRACFRQRVVEAIFRYMVRTGFCSVGLAILLSACLPGGSRRPSPSLPAPAPIGTVLNTQGPWRVGLPTGFEKVVIINHAIVVVSGETGVRSDTLQSTLGASYSWTSGATRKVDGQLTDYRVAAGPAVAAVPAGLQLTRPFSASAHRGAMVFTLPSESTACSDPALSALQGLQDAWPSLPAILTLGMEWTDTVHTLSCPDRVPLRGESVRRFQVRRAEIQEGSRVVVIIERSARGRLTGEGEQFGEKIAIAGESSGTMIYTFDPLTGRFVRATGNSALSFSLKSSRRNQSVRQNSALSIAW